MQQPTTSVGVTQGSATLAPAAQLPVPQTRAELTGLIAKRAELERQLENLTDRRQELFQQRQRMGRQEGQGLDNRITLIDDQSTQIERELLSLNSAIAQGTATVTGAGEEFATTSPPSARELRRDMQSAAEEAVVGAMFGSAAGIVAIYVLWRGIRRWIWKKKPAPAVAASAGPDQSPRLEQLQQSVDVIALEVERISEAQRFLAKVLNERVPALGAGDAQSVPARNRDALPERR